MIMLSILLLAGAKSLVANKKLAEENQQSLDGECRELKIENSTD